MIGGSYGGFLSSLANRGKHLRSNSRGIGLVSVAAVAAAIGFRVSHDEREGVGSDSDKAQQAKSDGDGTKTTAKWTGGYWRRYDSLMILLTAVGSMTFHTPNWSGNVTQILAELSTNPKLVDSMLSGNHNRLVGWLLDQLVESPPETAERKSAERVIAHMLTHPSSSGLLLSHSELFPKLLDYVVKNKFSDISTALKQASHRIVLGPPFTTEVVEKVLSSLLKSHVEKDQGCSLTHVCAWALACWSKSEEGRKTLLKSGALSVIADVLGKGAPMEDEDRLLLIEVVLNLLSSEGVTGRKGEDVVKMLLTPIIHNGAHAVANLNEDLLAYTINCLASLLEKKGIKLQTMQSEIESITLLLKHISKTFFIEADLCQDSLRAALARFLRASAMNEQDFQVMNTEIWIPRLMTWLFDSSKPLRYLKSQNPASSLNGSRPSSQEVYQSAMNTLMYLINMESRKGIQAAREWLAYFSLELCRFHEQELEKYQRGGATIGMLEERVTGVKEASAELLKACRTATTTALDPPKLPSDIQPADPNLPKEYAAAAIQVDETVAEIAVSKAMNALADLLSDDQFSQNWFLKSGALDILAKFVAGKSYSSDENLSTIDRDLSRLLAILSVNDHYKKKMQSSDYGKWHDWLQNLSKSNINRVGSNAQRALLNSRAKESTRGACLEINDGVHLLVPGSDHHSQASSDIDADIVFVHGLNGGPFSTWCIGTEDNKNMRLHKCWPTAWLSKEFPKVRLISLEYKTRVFDWQGAQHSFPEQSAVMLKKLSAAGVGQRPVIFVAHSMGGLMIKEMMMQGSEPDSQMIDKRIQNIVSNTKGVVFFSTPHFGSWIASSTWNMFFGGQKMKDTVNVLRGGPYLEGLNDFFRQFVKSNNVSVLSFCEAATTELFHLGLVPVKSEVVIPESAFPGVGDFFMVDKDHITVCKPKSTDELPYKKLEQFISKILNDQNQTP